MNYFVKLATLAMTATVGVTGASFAQSVTDTEIRVGVITDMSGPVAQFGKEGVNGQTMAMEEVNAAGGINGRQISMLVEDNGYDPKRAVLAAQKLINQNEVFAILGHLGTATNMAALPILIENEVFNFLPQGASSGLYEPADPYKVGLSPAYHDMAAITLKYVMDEVNPSAVCVLYQDDDFGKDVLKGVKGYLKSIDMEVAEETSYKRGATDFSSQMALMKSANCDLVFEATTLRELVGSITEARKIDFNPTFVTSAAAYAVQAPALGGDVMNGLYASSFIQIPADNSDNPAVVKWVEDYRARFGEEPGLYSMYGYYAMRTFAKVAEQAGEDLTPESFNAAMEANPIPADELGNPPFHVTADNRLSNRKIVMTKIEDGQWKTISDLLDPLDLDW